jgi:arabinan endo-1,5-alpha-L-arabinosidase
VLAASADWQIFQRTRAICKGTYDWHTLEGPSVVRRDGGYYCFYSGVVTTYGGTDMLVYHAWDDRTTKRMMCIDPLEWRADGPHTPGPSWEDRPLPE